MPSVLVKHALDESTVMFVRPLQLAKGLKPIEVTAAGIAALKARMPFADLSKFEANPSVQNFANTLTVEDMVRYVQSKLAA